MADEAPDNLYREELLMAAVAAVRRLAKGGQHTARCRRRGPKTLPFPRRAGTSPVCARRFWKGRSIFSRATESGPAVCEYLVCTNERTAKCRPSSSPSPTQRRSSPWPD